MSAFDTSKLTNPVARVLPVFDNESLLVDQLLHIFEVEVKLVPVLFFVDILNSIWVKDRTTAIAGDEILSVALETQVRA